MKYYKLAIGSPVYEEIYQYSKRGTKKVVKDECKKYFILRFTARLLDRDSAENMLTKIISDFALFTGCTGVVSLDSLSWGEQSSYDEESYVFKGAFCVPKNFDALGEQKALLERKCKDCELELTELAGFIKC